MCFDLFVIQTTSVMTRRERSQGGHRSPRAIDASLLPLAMDAVPRATRMRAEM
jgi:hypothetical protein